MRKLGILTMTAGLVAPMTSWAALCHSPAMSGAVSCPMMGTSCPMDGHDLSPDMPCCRENSENRTQESESAVVPSFTLAFENVPVLRVPHQRSRTIHVVQETTHAPPLWSSLYARGPPA